MLVERLEKPLGESAQLLGRRLRLLLQPAVLVSQTPHFILEGDPSTCILVPSQLYAGELGCIVRLTTLPKTKITTNFVYYKNSLLFYNAILI